MRLVLWTVLALGVGGCASAPPPSPPPPPPPPPPWATHPGWNNALTGALPALVGKRVVPHRRKWDEPLGYYEVPTVLPSQWRSYGPCVVLSTPAPPPPSILPWSADSPTSSGNRGNVVSIKDELDTSGFLIDLGSAHGVSVGHVFTIVKSGRSIAHLLVDRVSLAQSHCRATLPEEGAQINLGDRVVRLGSELGSRPQEWRRWPAVPAPAIDTAVIATKGDVEPQLVLLGVGENRRVEPGFEFSIYRGDRFIGKVRVERVLRDAAGCRVLFLAKDQQVLPGDLAATRLQ